MNYQDWKKKNLAAKGYSHFDRKVGLASVEKYIMNEDKVAKHSFYPFIRYKQVFQKFSKENNEVNMIAKPRPICYSAHMDRYIYQYYSFLLNEKYNDYVSLKNMSSSIVAYRTNLNKNNINFAKEAFDFIKLNNCKIIVGDFEKFFDKLNHIYLKQMLKKVLNVVTLPDDYYAVLKNITKYSTWELKDILSLNNLTETRSDIRKLNKTSLVLTKDQFRQHKKEYIKGNPEPRGIPQGSAISAVLSNVYMIEFDEKISIYVKALGGLYLRYSDDFIIIIPDSSISSFKEVYNKLTDTITQTKDLVLQPAKTQIYHFQDQCIANITELYIENVVKGKEYIDYLGFVFDGKIVTVRGKTISKYYSRMYKKLYSIYIYNKINKEKNQNNFFVTYKNLYLKYTHKGRNPKPLLGNNTSKGNFLTYIYRAEKIFGKDEGVMRSTKRHMLKIRRKRDQLKANNSDIQE